MLIFGEVLSVYDGREYQGKTPKIVKLLDRTGTRAESWDINIDTGQESEITAHVGKNVLLEYTMLTGRNDKGRWHMMVNGRLVSTDVLDRITAPELGFVGVGK